MTSVAVQKGAGSLLDFRLASLLCWISEAVYSAATGGHTHLKSIRYDSHCQTGSKGTFTEILLWFGQHCSKFDIETFSGRPTCSTSRNTGTSRGTPKNQEPLPPPPPPPRRPNNSEHLKKARDTPQENPPENTSTYRSKLRNRPLMKRQKSRDVWTLIKLIKEWQTCVCQNRVILRGRTNDSIISFFLQLDKVANLFKLQTICS